MKEKVRKVYTRDLRIAEIRRIMKNPEGLDDIAINMVYSILVDSELRR